MFHERESNKNISKIHERALRIIHRNSTSNFEECLIKNDSVSVHRRNLLLLLTEMYKTVNNLNPSFMAEVIVTKDVPYGLRSGNNLVLPKAKTNLYGIDTSRFIGQKLWQTLPKEVKESQSLEIFKRNISPSKLWTAAANCAKTLFQI